jgi:Fe-S oxidoreductase
VADATRPIFEHLPDWMVVTFYVLVAVSTGLFLFGWAIRLRKYLRGRPIRLDQVPTRILRAARDLYSSRTIGHRDRFAGSSHALILWGFTALFIGTVILSFDYDILRRLFNGYSFYKGTFYLGYKLTLDILGLGMLAGLILMGIRRGWFRLFRLDYRRVDNRPEAPRRLYRIGDWVFVGWLFLLGFTGFILEGLRIAADHPSSAGFSPVGSAFAAGLQVVGLQHQAGALHTGLWAFHAAIALAFVAYIPYSKAVHIVASGVNLIFRDRFAASRLPAPADQVATGTLGDLSWKQLIALDACTKCGRCHEVCPARASGAPLSPRDLILDLREYADRMIGLHTPATDRLAAAMPAELVPRLAGHVIAPETLWACTTCMACVEACPVGIEHVPLIVGMRQTLVEAGQMDGNLQAALQNLGKHGNSFGTSPRLRGRWAQSLSFPIKDARKAPVEYLWFVGDFASYDPRLQDVSRATARVFQALDLDFGILFDAERNAGNDVRRVGEEGLYEMLREQNTRALAGCEFATIVTTDPHSYNTLKKEYSNNGTAYQVLHYTELLAQLLEGGRLTFTRPLSQRVTYHDPCYLGRYNGVYEAPRALIRATGAELVDMPRCRANALCCGAGGGRIWMTDTPGQERPSEQRIREALTLPDVGTFVVACPKDVTMYAAAAKALGVEERMQVKELVELVEMAL